MLKSIYGRLFLTGTSAGSLYPVALVDGETGLHLGVRVEVKKTNQPAVLVGLYGRLQKIDEDGKPVPFTTAELFRCCPDITFRAASATHMSGILGQAPMPLPPGVSVQEAAKSCGEGVYKILYNARARLFKNMKLQPKDHIVEAAVVRFLGVMIGDVSEEKLEQQLAAAPPSFDLGSLTDKFGPLPKAD